GGPIVPGHVLTQGPPLVVGVYDQAKRRLTTQLRAPYPALRQVPGYPKPLRGFQRKYAIRREVDHLLALRVLAPGHYHLPAEHLGYVESIGVRVPAHFADRGDRNYQAAHPFFPSF